MQVGDFLGRLRAGRMSWSSPRFIRMPPWVERSRVAATASPNWPRWPLIQNLSPRFDLAYRLNAEIRATQSKLSSPNIAASLEGSDPRLKSQYVAISAHLDHLGSGAPAKGDQQGIEMVPDPLPDRNVFIRTDQFSFVREGIPALVFKFGFAKNTPEFDIEHDWRANRYHAPSDDLQQPVLKEEAVKLDTLVAALAKRIADADTAPRWLPDSIFRGMDSQKSRP